VFYGDSFAVASWEMSISVFVKKEFSVKLALNIAHLFPTNMRFSVLY